MLAVSWLDVEHGIAAYQSAQTGGPTDFKLSPRVAGAGSARNPRAAVALFLPFRWVNTLSARQDKW
jgi:hypothetical protein